MDEGAKAQAPLSSAELHEVRAASVQKDDLQGTAPASLVLYFATADDETPHWWSTRRDRYLRKFWPKEPYLAGAIYSLCARNASFKFMIEGPPRQKKRVERLLSQMGYGRGWHVEMLKVSADLLSQDNGAFVEVIRPARVEIKGKLHPGVKAAEPGGEMTWSVLDSNGRPKPLVGVDYEVRDSPYDLPLALAHLDAGRCTRTGNPDFPVVYTDRYGANHQMAFWQVMVFEDMPSPQLEMNDVGYCAVTRVLRLARILYDMQVYKGEKVGGRFRRAIYLTNAGRTAILTALAEADSEADAHGLLRYTQPLIVSSMDPTAQISLQTIELASLPDGFSEEETLRWYIAGIALGTGVDYGFLAPLPGRGLGTAAESEVQARTARGKSSRLFMRMVETRMNYTGVLPRSCEFGYGEIDPEEESTRDEARERRARTRQIRIESGEITPEVARQLAIEDGDLKDEHLALMLGARPTEELLLSPPVE